VHQETDRSLISALLSFLYYTHISITYILGLFFFLTGAILDNFFIRVCYKICAKIHDFWERCG